MTGRDINQRDVSGYDTVFRHARSTSTGTDFGEQHQVQIGSKNSTQTGSTNNLTAERDIDAISVAIRYTYVFGASLSLVYMPTSPSFTKKNQKWWTDTGSSYNFATENDMKLISAAAAMI